MSLAKLRFIYKMPRGENRWDLGLQTLDCEVDCSIDQHCIISSEGFPLSCWALFLHDVMLCVLGEILGPRIVNHSLPWELQVRKGRSPRLFVGRSEGEVCE